MQHRDLNMDTMSLVLLSGLCLDCETQGRSQGPSLDLLPPGAALWWAMACLLALILDHILQPEAPASADGPQMGNADGVGK